MRTRAGIAGLIARGARVFLVTNLSVFAIPTLGAPEPLAASGAVRFKGTSTLHDFHGHVAVQPFTIELPPPGQGTPRTWSARAELRVGEMTTEDKGRDQNMSRMFSAERFPSIHAVVRDAAVPTNSTAKVEATIGIRDTERTVPITISNWKENKEGVSFHATFDVSLKSFSLKPPSVLMIIRVGDRVVVESDVQASRNGTASSQSAANP